ncbi:efflux RND transporter periplasmic adaptor subunit [Croceiramulus getboli]|nr:efflux RND transporter periplasmic adaptor subunit [Flavobacteriaceae bacterium YJPT1-3]
MRIIYHLLLGSALISCQKEKDTITAEERPISESVYASVTIVPDSLYQAYAIVNGTIDAVYVEENQRVKPGDALFKIDNINSKMSVRNASLAVDLAFERYEGGAALLEDIEQQIQTAAFAVQLDSLNYERQKRLWEQRIGSLSKLENSALQLERSKSQWRALKNNYALTKAELQNQLEQARNNYQSARSIFNDYSVKSEIDGLVYSVNKKRGESVNPMEPLATLGSASNFLIRMLIDERDIVEINLDQQVLVALDAYPEQVFQAHVSKIYPQKDLTNQTFVVEASFVDPPKTLYSGMSGEGNIIIQAKEKAIVIPQAYVTPDCKVRTPDGLLTVQTGIETTDSIEIIEGLQPGDQLLKPER